MARTRKRFPRAGLGRDDRGDDHKWAFLFSSYHHEAKAQHGGRGFASFRPTMRKRQTGDANLTRGKSRQKRAPIHSGQNRIVTAPTKPEGAGPPVARFSSGAGNRSP
jgi:hypothetical protein